MACLAATSLGQSAPAEDIQANCMPEGGYCLYGSCCSKDDLVCNTDTLVCEKASAVDLSLAGVRCNTSEECPSDYVCNGFTHDCDKAETVSMSQDAATEDTPPNCFGEGGYCAFGTCCTRDGLVCNTDTLMCEKASQP